MQDKSCKTPRWQALKSQLNNLEPKQFIEKLASNAPTVLIDVRTADEFYLSHIDGAINIDYLYENFWDEIEKLSNDIYIFVYCRTGRRSIRACTLMRNGGFDKDRIFNLDGGYAAFLEKNRK